MKKVTSENIIEFNTLYHIYKNYSRVARETGFAPSTVKKYVIKNWKPVEVENITRFELSGLPDYKEALKIFRGVDNYGYLCQLTAEENEEIKELWKELAA